MNVKTKKSRFQMIEKSIFTIVFILFTIYTLMLLYPTLWGFFSSFKTINLYFDDPFALPDKWQLKNYVLAFEQISAGDTSFIQMFWNSTWFAVPRAFIGAQALYRRLT